MVEAVQLKKTIMNYLSPEIGKVLSCLSDKFFNEAEEIRLRANKPIIIKKKGREFFITKTGELSYESYSAASMPVGEIEKTLMLICDYSPYAYEAEVAQGYVTLPGGHRVGLCGRAVMQGDKVRTLRSVSGLNFRIAHEVPGCGLEVVEHLFECKSHQLLNTMIISPPCCGKTTLLRDVVRLLSDGIPGKFAGQAVAVVDERSEIAGCYMGVAQNDVGLRTDILDGCSKAQGMLMLLRSMGPRVIAVDEVAGADDVKAVAEVVNSGVSVVCTVHGSSFEEIAEKPVFSGLFQQQAFRRFIILQGIGNIAGVCNERGEVVTI